MLRVPVIGLIQTAMNKELGHTHTQLNNTGAVWCCIEAKRAVCEHMDKCPDNIIFVL